LVGRERDIGSLRMKSGPIATIVVSSIPSHGKVCSIQLYVIQIFSAIYKTG